MRSPSFLQSPVIIMLSIWLFMTAINITKAFQLDDGFHLQAAEYIAKNPLKPMSGIIRWDTAEPQPMHYANQPPLLFYMIAGVALLFGFNEIPLHILISIFTLLALHWFYKMAKLTNASSPLLLLALFGFCPAFIVNQNVFTDVPLLSMLLGGLYYLLLADKTGKKQFDVIAIILFTIGLFIKYTMLPVIASVALLFIITKQYQKLWLLLIPVMLVLLWSFWNYQEYGGVHILNRKIGSKTSALRMLWSFVSCLGSIAPFGVIFWAYLFKKRLTTFLTYTATGIFLLVAVFYYLGPSTNEAGISQGLEVFFFLNGFAIILATILICRVQIKQQGIYSYFQSSEGTISIILAAISVFIILFAPFIATRHILLTIPLFLLLAEPATKSCTKGLLRYAVLASFGLGLILGISDWKYADYYRISAKRIMETLPQNNTVWMTGTGGWQWYALHNGMKLYTVETSHVKKGDYIVIASQLPYYRIDSGIEIALVGKISGSVTPLTYFSVSNGAGMYYTDWEKPTWTLSKRSMDTIYVVQSLGMKP